MVNNDTLRRIRYMLNLSDNHMAEIVKLAGRDVGSADMNAWLKREDDSQYQACPDDVMAHFLNGLIIFRRGQKEQGTACFS